MSSPCAAAVSGAASASAATVPASQSSRFIDASLSADDGNADHLRELAGKLVVGGDQRIAGLHSVAGEEVAGVPARLAHEQDARGAVPGVDMQLAVGLAAPRGDVGETERAGSD